MFDGIVQQESNEDDEVDPRTDQLLAFIQFLKQMEKNVGHGQPAAERTEDFFSGQHELAQARNDQVNANESDDNDR